MAPIIYRATARKDLVWNGMDVAAGDHFDTSDLTQLKRYSRDKLLTYTKVGEDQNDDTVALVVLNLRGLAMRTSSDPDHWSINDPWTPHGHLLRCHASRVDHLLQHGDARTATADEELHAAKHLGRVLPFEPRAMTRPEFIEHTLERFAQAYEARMRRRQVIR